jgi:hypothetical protein
MIHGYTIQYFRVFNAKLNKYTNLDDVAKGKDYIFGNDSGPFSSNHFHDCIIERSSGWHDKGNSQTIFENDVVKRGDYLYVVKFDPFSHHFYLGTNIRRHKKSSKYDAYIISLVKSDIGKQYSTNSYLTESSAAKLKKICPARFFNQESLDLAKGTR